MQHSAPRIISKLVNFDIAKRTLVTHGHAVDVNVCWLGKRAELLRIHGTRPLPAASYPSAPPTHETLSHKRILRGFRVVDSGY